MQKNQNTIAKYKNNIYLINFFSDLAGETFQTVSLMAAFSLTYSMTLIKTRNVVTFPQDLIQMALLMNKEIDEKMVQETILLTSLFVRKSGNKIKVEYIRNLRNQKNAYKVINTKFYQIPYNFALKKDYL